VSGGAGKEIALLLRFAAEQPRNADQNDCSRRCRAQRVVKITANDAEAVKEPAADQPG